MEFLCVIWLALLLEVLSLLELLHYLSRQLRNLSESTPILIIDYFSLRTFS